MLSLAEYFPVLVFILIAGVIATAVDQGDSSVTWQPQDGLRFATVELRAGDRVVMAGQSLEPSETRTQNLGALLLLGWLAGVVIFAVGALVRFSSEGKGRGEHLAV